VPSGAARPEAERDTGTGGTAMGPTTRDWLGAGALALVLAVLVVLLVAASLPSDGGSAAALRALA